jgi:pSer/pThr/pTyr-binding forkhead associated (FHA) protein
MAQHQINGELIPLGGGDSIPLTRTPLVIGRREACDICLQFSNISGAHCELSYKQGLWILRDLESKNGTLVNDLRMDPGSLRIVHNGDIISIGKRSFKIEYVETGRAADLAEFSEEMENIVKIPLLEKANLVHPPRHARKPVDPDKTPIIDE